MRVLVGAIVACTLAAPAAFAQQPAQPANPPAATQAAPMAATGQWRASKVIGVNVYNQQDERLGEINDLILDSNGRVAGAVIGVGGFLGIGERNVMIPMDRIKLANESGMRTTGAAGSDRQWHPDRAVVNANKDQLKNMAEFKY
jgi:sporulation protein YlmC with PRC-barrel domain